MKQYHVLTFILCGIWVISILYGEMFAFWLPSLGSCYWPHHQQIHHHDSSTNLKINKIASSGNYVKVAVVTDPQVMDRTSLHLPPKSLALEIAQFYTDLYMSRAFFASILPLKPDIILFLGDYFDGGPYLSDEEWQESLYRFKHIFDLNVKGRSADIQVYYIPGNHDIGYAGVNSHKPKIIRRYEGEFGVRNHRFIIGKVEFVAVDSQSLDGSSLVNSKTWEFIRNVSEDTQVLPRVLLTHIPLYRPDYTHCGPNRKSPVINQRISRSSQSQEILYQNYVTVESSNQLLNLIKPVLILSGHDHDQCTMTHESKLGPVKEHTVGTISWQQGNLYPSFMLLSVSDSANANVSNPEEILMTELCFLPLQTHIYIWYLSLFALTVLSLLFWPASGISFGHYLGNVIPSIRLLYRGIFTGGTKEKNDDEDCEYEMVWDSEGSMHLVKKLQQAPIPRPTDRTSVERGNAVIRPTAKRNTSQEMEVSMNINTDADVGHDPTIKFSHRTSTSKIIIRRLVRTFGMIMVIATVNVPLYMMLLFKDWIDL